MLRIQFLSLAVLACLGGLTPAQQQPPTTPLVPQQPPPPPPDKVAATVNGHPILEMAVYRGMLGAEIAKRETVRPEVLSFLIDNVLIDQYLEGQKINVDAKEVGEQVAKLKAEIDATGRTVDDFCKSLYLTEADLRTQIAATTRWDKFVMAVFEREAASRFLRGQQGVFRWQLEPLSAHPIASSRRQRPSHGTSVLAPSAEKANRGHGGEGSRRRGETR